jgi:THO complex subunit 2
MLVEGEGAEVSVDMLLNYSPELSRSVVDILRWSTFSLYSQLKPSLTSLNNKDLYKSIPNIPSAQYPVLVNIKDLVTHVVPVLTLVDYHLAEQPRVFGQIAFLLEKYIAAISGSIGDSNGETMDVEVNTDLNNLCTNMLLPLLRALSVSGSNATAFSLQLYPALQLLPYEVRFALYHLWQHSTSKPALVLHAEKCALQGARYELKRLAKENVKQVGRNLSKLLHSNPHVVIVHLLNQIENFDNLIPYIVDSMKFSTDLSRDVFALHLVAKLKSSKLSKVKEGFTSYAGWFLTLSKFIGTMYGKFPNTEIRGLLHYLLQSLSAGEAADLLVLKDLLAIMAGSDTLLEVSAAQLEGLSGGKVLRNEILVSANSNVTAKQSKRAAAVLRDALISSHTALPLLLFIAKIRNQVLFQSSTSAIKLISGLYDTAQDVLMQFADFLVSDRKSVETVATLMPGLRELVVDIGLSVSLAFQLVRPLLRAALQHSASSTASMPSYLQRWHISSPEIRQVVEEKLSANDLWQSVSLDFYLTFWTLSTYDIYTPSDKYQVEIKRLKDKYSELDRKKHSSSYNMNMSSSEYNKQNRARELEMKQTMQLISALSEEMLAHKNHLGHTKERLVEGAKSFLKISDKSLVSSLLLQHMVLPRECMSPIDAVYCAKFLYMLHEVDLEGFSLLHTYNDAVRLFVSLLYSTTEAEASFIGYALAEILQVVNRWTRSEALFNLEYNRTPDASTSASCSTNIVELLTNEESKISLASASQHDQYVALAKVSIYTLAY